MAFRPTQARTFFRTLKNMVREQHPFARNTSSLLPHKHDNLTLARRTVRTAGPFAALMATVLGWPLATSAVLTKTGI